MLCTVNLTCQMEKFPNSLDIFHICKSVIWKGEDFTRKTSELIGQIYCQNKTGPIRFYKCQLSKLVTVWGILLVPIYGERRRSVVSPKAPQCLINSKPAKSIDSNLVLFFALLLKRERYPVLVKHPSLQHSCHAKLNPGRNYFQCLLKGYWLLMQY